MKEFPTAAEMAKLTPEDLALWDMEHELKYIKRQMFEATRMGHQHIVRFHMLESTIEFLRDHGYSVELKNGTDYFITWGKTF